MAKSKGSARPYQHDFMNLDVMLMDSENPRHEPIVNEPEIIAWLVKHESVYPLAKKIVELGDLSPLESVGVFPHKTKRGYFVVAEGNRRVCALTLLKDPSKAPTAAWRKKFIELKAAAAQPLPERIEVAKFDSEEASLPWKTLRHSGEQGGAGTRKWKNPQITRNLKKVGQFAADTAAHDLLDYAESAGIINKEQREQISTTTITRHISNPVMRSALGLASAREFAIQAPQDQVDKALGVFLRDAVSRSGKEAPINSRNKKPAIDAYAAKLRADGHAVTSRLTAPITPAPSKAKRARNNRSPNDRSRVVPREFAATIKNRTVKRLYDELREIPIDGDPSFPFAANYLLRAFIEHLSGAYAKDHGLSQAGKMHQVIERCVKHLQASTAVQAAAGGAQKLEDQLKAWRLMHSNPDNWLSPHTMGSGVHGNLVPTKSDLIARWENLEAGIVHLLAGLK